MIRDDYIMRLIEMFSESMRKILRMEREGKVEEALETVGETYRNLLGLNPEIVHIMEVEDIKNLIEYTGIMDEHKIQILAKLLIKEGDLLLQAKDKKIAKQRYLKALELLSRISDNSIKLQVEKKIKEIDACQN
ncbi:MAG TPA: hypothetical protein ENF18_02000 [candidate division WOR-3 bacterium]|uniref:Tetratricopeptide repeat protein n=1 Tax=candidate division WOR-3 bacterium TaxID=2052148 RepID=A0A7C0VB29_UNCW3|nr:hypothetical protein [candidate division WOR-3 bacterium]